MWDRIVKVEYSSGTCKVQSTKCRSMKFTTPSSPHVNGGASGDAFSGEKPSRSPTAAHIGLTKLLERLRNSLARICVYSREIVVAKMIEDR